jgi:Tfp pilus assembly protein PilN
LTRLPDLTSPSLAAALVLAGAPALGVLLVVLAGRVLGPMSAWEQREAALLKTEQAYLRTRVSVIGRPG